MMKKILTIVIAMVMTLTTAFACTGCQTDPKTLEDYLADSPEARQEIRDAMSGLENKDMAVTVAYEADKVIITCDMKTTYKKDVLKAIKKSYKKSCKKLDDPMEAAVTSIETQTGFTDVVIDLRINNGNGKKIWSGSWPKEEEPPASEATDET